MRESADADFEIHYGETGGATERSGSGDLVARGGEQRRQPQQSFFPPWAELLDRVLTQQVLPRVVASHLPLPVWVDVSLIRPSAREVEQFLGFILTDDLNRAHVLIDQFTGRGADHDMILHDLLTPAARRLGVLWEEDRCDFAAVTLAMVRLNQILVENGPPADLPGGAIRVAGHALFAAAPGEQHTFGIAVLTDVFSRAGWLASAEPRSTRTVLLGIARRNWLDVIGLSVTTDRWLKGLPAIIRSLRAVAPNPDLHVMVGGKAFLDYPERCQFVGADSMAADAQDALRQASVLTLNRDAARR
ncbi:MAG TPA: cobalamin B12-binding domain-containing protein [Acidiphilium sp.]|jgi:methanogenic corrinoid protein MtbC1|uniref:cobalamin B12-binding domain-containing protein n=1 Tax=unclassified Acidiphilium TaxID=2617493 RepID=UPI000BDB2FF8|nr:MULTISPECIES: cobalamin B12-binding domain-containing protein [unclassified Acidiphilium]OYV56417.1 MAG: cobalamin-binding protein [Acidiphilium sp. 20-67-58]OYV87965.1 MAG: cobalamin-binding protein [Acidiphilium sp. 21-68-69]HQT59903.1 cobalamin B12-binding domain-containing protein [Acidiphilium sp.]HQU10663.1 cobalamin B12-binding domain-containing protein [Acidiphilium sp.]